MAPEKRFSLSSLLVGCILIGFVGFGLGTNYEEIRFSILSSFSSRQSSLPVDLNYEGVESVYDVLRENFAGELDASALIEGAKRGLVAAAGDPNTVYLDKEAAKEFKDSLEGTFSGIGAEIAVKNERLVVVAPISQSPADKAGLSAGDHIVSIDGESTADMSVETAVSKIRGDAGTEVALGISRGNKPVFEAKITRAQIEVPTIETSRIDGIGHIKLLRFDSDTAQKLSESVNTLKLQGINKFVLDLRNNPGGLLGAAVAVTDEILDVGQVIVEERKDGEVIQTFRSAAGGSLVGSKIIVLINEGSASASEIVAGALQDHGAAQIVGETSFGKGSVQELVQLTGAAFLKVTIALWHTPSGANINENGVKPDIEVKLSDADFNNNKDPQLQRALELLR